MKVPYFFDKCILCLKNPADSWEHTIPECIGGRVELRSLCADCNKKMGTELISQVPKDPSIKLAMYYLRNQIPKLFKKYEKHLTYFDKDENKIVRMKRKGSKMKVLTEKVNDSVFIMDTKDALKHIRRMLKKDGIADNDIYKKIKYIQELENNKIIRISNTLLAEKKSGVAKNISLKDAAMDDRVIAMIAYNSLNLIILNSIYTDRLNFLREYIKEGKSSNRILIEHLRTTAETYGLFHRIFSKSYENEIIINIILFDYLLYRFHLKGFKFYDPVLVYLEDLKNNISLYSPSIEEAEKNIYYLFKFKST